MGIMTRRMENFVLKTDMLQQNETRNTTIAIDIVSTNPSQIRCYVPYNIS